MSNNPEWKKNITLFMVSQSITLFGSALVQFAISWYVALETKSGAMVSLMLVSGFLPQVVLSLFSGAWADRFNRRKLINIADACIAASTLVLIVLMNFIDDYFWALLVASAVRSAGTGIQTPAVSAAIPQLVPKEQLMRINSLSGSLQSLIGFVAPAVAGAILSFGRLQYLMLIDVVTAAIGITMLMRVPIPTIEREPEELEKGIFDDLKTGVRYVLGHKYVKAQLIILFVYCFVISPAWFLNPLFVARVYGDSYIYLTINEMIYFIGAVAGGLLLSAWGGFKNRVDTMCLSTLIFAVTTLVISTVKIFWVYAVMGFIMGVSVPMGNTPVMVMLQEKTEPEMHGRVFALTTIINSTVMPLAMLIYGPLADAVPIEWLFICASVELFALTAVVFCWRSFRAQGVKPEYANAQECARLL